MHNKPPVIVIGNNITSLGVIRGLRERDFEIHTVSDNRFGLSAASKYSQSNIIIDINSSNYAQKLAMWIKSSFITKPIIMIAGNDPALVLLSKEYEFINHYAICTFPDWSIVKNIIHKEKINKLVEELDIPTIKTTSIKNLDGLYDYLKTIDSSSFPLFMKCSLSSQFLKLFGTKGIVCNNEEDIISAYEKYDNFLGNLLIQEYLTGDLDEIFAVLLVLNKESKVVAISANKKIRSSREFGTTSLSSSSWNQKVVENAVKIAESSKYIGSIGIQFKFDPKTDEYKFLEVNGRFSVSVSLSQRCGVNLPLITYKVFTELNAISPPNDFRKKYKENILLWWPLDDARLLIQKRFYKNPLKYIKSLFGNGYIIEPFSIKDLMPTFKLLSLPLIKKFFK